MSYQVLARKWRPRIFREMVGQEHVLQALINALDHNRLHHAYLFTGTRGVGKTTIARILAKCLNCEVGVSSEPCGQCSACREIAEGRFVDLIEVDAASRTKVEDTRELLENVQYAPSRGRYKVYLIDEVHMLSNSSFNALLKTLEEPPPHVKFLLATTDPQKLPMTILSRCLQFNLKNMNPERIVQHLQFVLDKELVPFEESALWHLGRAADGSMRDAMSLTDQAIAYGSGKITEAEVSTMLGTIDQAAVFSIMTALAATDGRAVLAAIEQMSEQAPDYASALAEMLSLLHRIAIAQALPEAVDNSHGDRDKVLSLAQQIPSEDIQLFYQTALLGRRDLPLAPDPRAGFEMVLLRMLAFKPQGVMDVPKRSLPQPNGAVSPSQAPQPSVSAAPAPAQTQPVALPDPVPPSIQQASAPEAAPAVPPVAVAQSSIGSSVASPMHAIVDENDLPPFDGPFDNAEAPRLSTNLEPAPQVQAAAIALPTAAAVVEYEVPVSDDDEGISDYEDYAAQTVSPNDYADYASTQIKDVDVEIPAASVTEPMETASILAVPTDLRKIPFAEASPVTWLEIYLGLGVTGILQSTVSNCQLVERQGNQFHFVLSHQHTTLYNETHQQRLADLLTDYFAELIHVTITVGDVVGETPAAAAIRRRAERQADAENAIHSDPIVQALIAQFDAVIREDSIAPL